MQMTPAALVGAGALAVLAFALAWWLWWRGNDQASVPAHRADEGLSAVPVSPAATEEPLLPEATAREGEERRPDLADVRAACGESPWRRDVPEACSETLDRRYRDELAIYVRDVRDMRPWMPLPNGDRVTWGDALADPVGLRRTVADALEDPECLAVADALGGPGDGSSDPYRHDLRGRCAADAIARLSAFHYACIQARAGAGDWNWDEDPFRSEVWGRLDEEDIDFDGYHRQRRALEDAWFQLGWRVQRCRAVPDAAFAELGTGGRRENNPTWLQFLAARLGNEWANALDYGAASPGSGMCGDNPDPNLDALAEWHLPLAHASLARCYARDDVRHAAHLLAAIRHDRDGRLDWTGWRDGFTETQLADAEAEATRIYERGWEAPYTP